MPKRRKCKLKSLPERQCKKPKITISLREKKKLINYDETIEISSEDSKDKQGNEQIESIDNSSNSDVVILEKGKPSFFESINITFQDEPVDNVCNSIVYNVAQNSESSNTINDENSNENKQTTINQLNKKNSKTPSVISCSSAISLSSCDSKSTNSERKKRKSRKPSPISEEIFYVEKILDMKIENGVRLFFLKWEGFPDSENSWEPEENIESNAMVQEFLEHLEKINDIETLLKNMPQSNTKPEIQSNKDDKNIFKNECEEIKNKSNEISINAVNNDNSINAMSDEHSVNPLSNENPVNPVCNENSINAISNENPVNPVCNENSVNSISNENSVNSVFNENSVNAISNESSVNVISNESSVNAISNENLVNPVSNENSVNSISNENPVNSISNENPVNAVINESSVDVANEENISSIIQVSIKMESNEKENNVVIEAMIESSTINLHFEDDVTKSCDDLDITIIEETNNSVNKKSEDKAHEKQENDIGKQNLPVNEENKQSSEKFENQTNEETKSELASQISEIPLVVLSLKEKNKSKKKKKKARRKLKKIKINNKSINNSGNNEKHVPVEPDEIFPMVSQRTRKNMKSLKEILDSSDLSDISVHENMEFEKSEGHESDSSEPSNKSNKNANSNDSKDLNSYFPSNMPQTVQEIFMVEKILKMKVINGVRKFFLKWEGFPDSENTWEPEENLECPELIKEFLAEQKKIKNTRKRKRLSSADSLALEELPIEVQIKEPVVKPRGFPRSREPDCILAAGMMNDQLMFLVKWKNVDMANLVSARRANIECPQAVIRFYETHLNWLNTDHLKLSSVPKENLADEIEDEFPKQTKNNYKKSTTNLKDSMNCLISLLDDDSNDNAMKSPVILPNPNPNPKTKPKPKPKPLKNNRNLILPCRRGRPITKLFTHNMQPKKSSIIGSSSHSMMNLIRNFKNPKLPQPVPRSSVTNFPPRPLPPPTPLENLSREYDSRDIPKEPSPRPKFELPKPHIQIPILRPINSYRPDFNPRRFAISSRQQTNISQMQQNVPQKISMPSMKPTMTMPTLKAAPNVTVVPHNYSISNYEIPTANNYMPIDTNIQLINGGIQQNIPNSNSLSHFLQVVDSITNEFPVSQSPVQQMIAQDQKPLTYNNISDPPVNNYIQSNNFHNPINQMRSMAVSIDQQMRSNQLDPVNNYPQNYNNIQTANNHRSTARMQLASAIQSRYQANPSIVMHSNIIPSTNQLNIYQSQNGAGGGQLSVPQYQFVINQPQNYSNQNNLIQSQQQSFFAQPSSMSPSPMAGSTRYILPKADSYSMQVVGVGDMNQQQQQHLIQSSQNQYQHNLNPQNPEIQNSYLKYRAFL